MRDDDSTTVLALNVGSSTIKFGLHRVGALQERVLLRGTASTEGDGWGALRVDDGHGRRLAAPAAASATAHEMLERIATLIASLGLPWPQAVGHRIVHGGPECEAHTVVDDAVARRLDAARRLAPLHVPAALAVLAAARQRFADLPHVACLDTAFHAGMPEVARTLALPAALRALGLRRYGFHGLSCASIVRQLAAPLPRRLVIAHLGHGASVTAVADGRSVDTSMALTPASGIVMSTRCGDIDPGVLVWLVREHGLDAAQLDALVNRESGLLGVSGLSGDMRALREAAAQGHAQARLAVELFCHSVRKQVGAMSAVLGGLDLLVLTGGIGENDEGVRDSLAGALPGRADGGTPALRVLPSLEDEQIARHTADLVAPPTPA